MFNQNYLNVSVRTHTHTRKLSYLFILVLLCSITSLTAQRRLDLSNYTMVWNDEFDYTGTQQQIHTQMFDVPNAKWLNGFSYKMPFTGIPDPDDDSDLRIITRSNVNVSGGTSNLTAEFNGQSTSTTWEGYPQNNLYPNPTTGFIQLTLEDDWCGAMVKIRDITGKLIQEYTNVCESLEINLSNYPNGIYIMQMQHNGKVETKKIIKY